MDDIQNGSGSVTKDQETRAISSFDMAPDGKPFDYIDETGCTWIMCACGHRAGGGVELGEKRALCPNCSFAGSILGKVDVMYPERLPDDVKEKV